MKGSNQSGERPEHVFLIRPAFAVTLCPFRRFAFGGIVEDGVDLVEDRVRRAVNTPDLAGRCALWQGGMEPNIPVGSDAGVTEAMARATKGAEREQREGASGKWVAHWKMVHIIRPVWERVGQESGQRFSETRRRGRGSSVLSCGGSRSSGLSSRGSRRATVTGPPASP